MNPKLGLSLAGLTLALGAMAQAENNATTTGAPHDPEHGRIGGPYPTRATETETAETTESSGDHALGPHGRIGGPYTDINNANGTKDLGPHGRVGGPYTEGLNATATDVAPTGLSTPVIPVTATLNTTTSKPAKATDFECGIHELTSADAVSMTPIVNPTAKYVSDLTQAVDPTWSNGTETGIFSINPITPTGPLQTPTPGTSPIYTTLAPGSSRNWNGTDAAVLPTGTLVTVVTVQGLNGTSSIGTPRSPEPNPTAHEDGETDPEEGHARKAAVSVGAIVAAALVAFGI